jgi:hypothetical protein
MRFEGRTIRKGVIRLDGNQFVNCTIEDCTIEFAGNLEGVVLIGCTINRCAIGLVGPALDTLAFLGLIYHQEGFTEIVEGWINGIRQVPQGGTSPKNN